MMRAGLDIVILGLSITSSWGNGHAVTYRGLVRELVRAGHRVLFLERETPWYAANRDAPRPPYGTIELYHRVDDLRSRWREAIRRADVVIVGSYVPDGAAVCRFVLEEARGVRAFYDIDTPVTLRKLANGACEYLEVGQIPELDLYLSFTGGPVLARIERELGAPRARALYCSADVEAYGPRAASIRWHLGYLGTYSADRQPKLEQLLVEPARALPRSRFVVAGPQYPADLSWAPNVTRIEHLAPGAHPTFYAGQRFTLNVTRVDMCRAGWSPSIRLFEAAACAVPVISDAWPGLDELFDPGEEILLASSRQDVLEHLTTIDAARRREIGNRARRRVLASHTAAHRARELVAYVRQAQEGRSRRARPRAAST